MKEKLEQVLNLLNEIKKESGGSGASGYVLSSGAAFAYTESVPGEIMESVKMIFDNEGGRVIE